MWRFCCTPVLPHAPCSSAFGQHPLIPGEQYRRDHSGFKQNHDCFTYWCWSFIFWSTTYYLSKCAWYTMKLEEYGAAKTLSKETNLQMQVECFGKLKSIHRSDLTDFFHAPNHQQHQPNHWVTPSFFMCSFRCLSTYIPSMLWLHMCDSRIIHPKPEHFCLPFFWGGGGLFKVNPWTCRGAQITEVESLHCTKNDEIFFSELRVWQDVAVASFWFICLKQFHQRSRRIIRQSNDLFVAMCETATLCLQWH